MSDDGVRDVGKWRKRHIRAKSEGQIDAFKEGNSSDNRLVAAHIATPVMGEVVETEWTSPGGFIVKDDAVRVPKLPPRTLTEAAQVKPGYVGPKGAVKTDVVNGVKRLRMGAAISSRPQARSSGGLPPFWWLTKCGQADRTARAEGVSPCGKSYCGVCRSRKLRSQARFPEQAIRVAGASKEVRLVTIGRAGEERTRTYEEFVRFKYAVRLLDLILRSTFADGICWAWEVKVHPEEGGYPLTEGAKCCSSGSYVPVTYDSINNPNSVETTQGKGIASAALTERIWASEDHTKKMTHHHFGTVFARVCPMCGNTGVLPPGHLHAHGIAVVPAGTWWPLQILQNIRSPGFVDPNLGNLDVKLPKTEAERKYMDDPGKAVGYLFGYASKFKDGLQSPWLRALAPGARLFEKTGILKGTVRKNGTTFMPENGGIHRSWLVALEAKKPGVRAMVRDITRRLRLENISVDSRVLGNMVEADIEDIQATLCVGK